MSLPHQKFIRYLTSRRHQDVAGFLGTYDLPVPDTVDLEQVAYELEPFPVSWNKTLLRTNVTLRRWLSRHDLAFAWGNPALVQNCLRILRSPKARECLEIGILRSDNPSTIASSASSFAGFPITHDTIEMFRDLMFDVDQTGSKDWQLYLWRRPNPVVKDEVERVRDQSAYDRSKGLPEADDLHTLEEISRIATRRMRSLSSDNSAASALAMSQLAKVAVDSIQRKVELKEKMGEQDDDGDILKLWHQQFELATVQQAQPITTLEDLNNGPTKVVGVSDASD